MESSPARRARPRESAPSFKPIIFTVGALSAIVSALAPCQITENACAIPLRFAMN